MSDLILNRAVEILNRGGVVVFPTDTIMGIGCRIDRENGVKRLFAIKGRVSEKAVPVLVDSIEMAKEYAEVSDEVEGGLMRKFWPGALTIVLRAKEGMIPEGVSGGGRTIGLRMPKNRLVLELIKRTGVPIIGTSANFSGEKSVFDSGSIDRNLRELVDLVIEGDCELKQSSTVIDVTQESWKIVRKGAVWVMV